MVSTESPVDPSLIPPLDPTLLVLSESEKAFLHRAISSDEEELRARILAVQQKAYEKYPYPCIRGFHFANQFMAANAIYPTVLAAGAEKGSVTLFLDLGCMMGTDVRRLVHDGYPASRILGCDLRPEYIESGYTLFSDKGTCAIHFIAADIFDLPTIIAPSTASAEPAHTPDLGSVTDLSQLMGTLSHIYTGALFHLFDEETQYGLAVRLALLLKKTPGAVVFGRHQGLEKEGYIDDHLGRKRYGHSTTSWRVLWEKVFAQVAGTDISNRVVVKAELTDGFSRNVFQGRRRSQMLYWSVQIV
ncbi:hypothetical protein C8Q74DRAFT_1450053 [Fomes fomentarius]|nr:hypothetical protein C8Q74DRAFT_1450053 [Fomes fomentarius]